jgi:type I restriction enzyme, S subunit
LLKGLEITIINKSEILEDNEEFRIDSEYYRKEYLQLYSKIENSPKLNELVYMSDLSTNGSFATVAAIKNDNNPKVVPFIRSGNVGDTFINLSELEFISKEAHSNLPKSTTRLHEIMMARKGKIGGASIIMPEQVNYNCNENVIKLDILKKEDLNPFYFTAYFNSVFGLKQIERLSTGNVQPWVSIFQIRKLMIPILDFHFQLQIQKLLEKAYAANIGSKYSYEKANDFLLAETGLKNFKLSNEPVNIKSFKESFSVTRRLDAEYYQKKYEQIIDKITSQNHDKLENIAFIEKSIEPGSNYYSEEKGLPFYRVSDYNKFGLSKPDKELTNSFVAVNKELIKKLKPKKGTILFSKDGSVGTAYLLRDDLDGITSGAVLHLKVRNRKEILPEYLTLALNSKLVQMQAERDAGGSIILHWRKEEIEQVVVPIIEFEKQEQIAALVEESFKLKTECERLLVVAKKAVEIAIETDEKTAIKFIKDNEI